MLEVTSENVKELLASDKPLVLDFWAEWCAPCRAISPVIEKLSHDFEGKVNIGKCNIGVYDEIAVDFSIRAVPTILFFKGGKHVDKQVGSIDEEALRARIKNLL